jgi:hypothetical protein
MQSINHEYSNVKEFQYVVHKMPMYVHVQIASLCVEVVKVHIFREGHKILRNLHQLFDWQYVEQIIGGDFA